MLLHTFACPSVMETTPSTPAPAPTPLPVHQDLHLHANELHQMLLAWQVHPRLPFGGVSIDLAQQCPHMFEQIPPHSARHFGSLKTLLAIRGQCGARGIATSAACVESGPRRTPCDGKGTPLPHDGETHHAFSPAHRFERALHASERRMEVPHRVWQVSRATRSVEDEGPVLARAACGVLRNGYRQPCTCTTT